MEFKLHGVRSRAKAAASAPFWRPCLCARPKNLAWRTQGKSNVCGPGDGGRPGFCRDYGFSYGWAGRGGAWRRAPTRRSPCRLACQTACLHRLHLAAIYDGMAARATLAHSARAYSESCFSAPFHHLQRAGYISGTEWPQKALKFGHPSGSLASDAQQRTRTVLMTIIKTCLPDGLVLVSSRQGSGRDTHRTRSGPQHVGSCSVYGAVSGGRW